MRPGSRSRRCRDCPRRPPRGLARRITGGEWQAVETGVAAVTERMLALLPAERAAALAEGSRWCGRAA
jgi:hypothetical protein